MPLKVFLVSLLFSACGSTLNEPPATTVPTTSVFCLGPKAKVTSGDGIYKVERVERCP